LKKRDPSKLPPIGSVERARYVADLKQLYSEGELVDGLDRRAARVPDRLLRALLPGLMPPEPAVA